MASGADTHTHTHTYIRTEVILRNQARAWFNNYVDNCTDTHTHTCIYAHTSIHTHTHVYTYKHKDCTTDTDNCMYIVYQQYATY